ncbi:MAG: D-sedoheptulose 7-phosphate isomerase [Dehalococcoidia bacterium]|nr:D-sedoheptulose 7-phosphate isomerase [Dehalococcoidia bacterium]
MREEDEVKRQLEDGIRLKAYLQQNAQQLVTIANEIVKAFKRGNYVYIFGNGGSAADAQHFAAELAGRFYMDRNPLPAIALTTNTSVLTAIANDYGYENIFIRQLRAMAKKGDVAIGIGVSGNSTNVVLALVEAKKRGLVTIGFTGSGGGKTAEIVDHLIAVPSKDTPRVQEAHTTIYHIVCYLVEKTLFGNNKPDK